MFVRILKALLVGVVCGGGVFAAIVVIVRLVAEPGLDGLGMVLGGLAVGVVVATVTAAFAASAAYRWLVAAEAARAALDEPDPPADAP